MESIAIVTTIGTYYDHIPQWAASIEALQRQPDEIVIAASEPWRVWTTLEKASASLPHTRVMAVDGDFLLSRFLNHAIAATSSDWIAWIGVDDSYHPEALNGLDELQYDVLTYGMHIEHRGTWRGGLLSDCHLYNPIPCGSPFRRWIWEATPFQEQLFPYEDWAFWIAAEHHGARATPSGRIDFTYRIHDQQIHHDEREATRRIQEWAKTLNAQPAPARPSPSVPDPSPGS